MAFLSDFLKFISYRGPADQSRFELLEDQYEGDGLKSVWEAQRRAHLESLHARKRGGWKAKVTELVQKAPIPDSAETQSPPDADPSDLLVSKDLQLNLLRMKLEFHCPVNQDVVIRPFTVLQETDAFILYIDGMTDKNIINNSVLRQLMTRSPSEAVPVDKCGHVADYVAQNLLPVNQIARESDFNKIILNVLSGMSALFIDGSDQCILIESRGYEKRAVSPPQTESVITGSQEAFTENLRTNISLVRKLIRNKDLVTELLPLGKMDNTGCALMYLQGVTNETVIGEVKRRLSGIDIDMVTGNGVLDQLLEDHPYALFPQILSTERPDRTAAFLMDGKVVVICEGTPFASAMPVTFFHLFHTSEDYQLRWQYGTFLRIVRIIAAFLAAFLPGLYVALILYHKEMIPTELLTSIARAKEDIPFPTVIEVLLMELSWELVREASVRVPGVVGQTLGIIGAIILGQAAVAAGLVSPILIIIVAITGLGSFAIPNFSLSFGVRVVRFVFTTFSALAGFYGLAASIFVVLSLACHMKSFGVPYFSPLAPTTKSHHDTILRMPVWMQNERSDFINPRVRMKAGRRMRAWSRPDDKEQGS